MSRETPEPAAAAITPKTFSTEELDLMQRCLKAAASGEYVGADDVKYVTGYSADDFAKVLRQFDDLSAVRQEDIEIVAEAVGLLCNFPTPQSHRLPNALGVSQLHLKWFWYRLLYLGDHWRRYALDSANRERSAKYDRDGQWRS